MLNPASLTMGDRTLIIKQNISFQRTLLIRLPKILVMTKKNMRPITCHSCHQWVFCLTRNMINYLLYIGYQNFTRIHIEKKYTAGFSICSTKELSMSMTTTKMLSAVKGVLQSYHYKVYSCSSFNVRSWAPCIIVPHPCPHPPWSANMGDTWIPNISIGK